MKKSKVYLLTSIFIISTVLPLTACSQQSNSSATNSVSTTSENTTVSKEDNKQNSKTESVNNSNSIEDISSSNSKIKETEGKVNNHISYPIFSNIENKDKINDLILGYAKKLENLYNGEDDMTLDINYEVKFKNYKYISIYFSGEVKGAAYPRKFKSTLNINIEKASAMRLNEITNVNDKFIEVFSKGIEAEFKALDTEVLGNYKGEHINTLLEQADKNESYISDVQSYFTDSEIVVVLSVTHALGDYMEVHIPKSYL